MGPKNLNTNVSHRYDQRPHRSGEEASAGVGSRERGRRGERGGDRAANEERTRNQLPDQPPFPIDFMTARTAVRETCRRRWVGSYREGVPLDHVHRRVSRSRPPKVNRNWAQREQAVLHQLRVNRYPILSVSLRRWRKPGRDGRCVHCEKAEDTTLHQIPNSTHETLGPRPGHKHLPGGFQGSC